MPGLLVVIIGPSGFMPSPALIAMAIVALLMVARASALPPALPLFMVTRTAALTPALSLLLVAWITALPPALSLVVLAAVPAGLGRSGHGKGQA